MNGTTASVGPARPIATLVMTWKTSPATPSTPVARCADWSSTRCRMSSTRRSVASRPSITVMLSETRATTPAKNSVKKNPYEYMTPPAPASSTPAHARPSAEAVSATIADFDIVRAPRLVVVVRTVVAFSFCCARAICSSIVSRRRPHRPTLLPPQVRRDGADGSPPVANFSAGFSNRPDRTRV